MVVTDARAAHGGVMHVAVGHGPGGYGAVGHGGVGYGGVVHGGVGYGGVVHGGVGLRAVELAGSWNDAMIKFGNTAGAIAGFLAVLLLVFFAAGRATGRFARPLAVLIFLGPALLLVLVGLVVPLVRTIVLSFHNDDSNRFVGAANYNWALGNDSIHQVLLTTLLWLLIVPVAATGLGLALALLVDRMRGQSIYKSLIFMPMAISLVGASIIWKFVYDWRDTSQSQIGLLSQLAIWLGWRHPPNWILSQPLNTFLLMVVMVWVQTGFAMVVLSAAIKAIPDEITEAARLDGAKGLRLFWYVTVPMIRTTLVVVLTTVLLITLKAFDIVRTMTGGNFGTQVLANEMYSQSFTQFNVGRGSALAVLLFMAVLPLVAYNIVQLRKERATR
ncbi:alpha-glucoside transport system permease protein [Kitasatospora sp. GP30]|uniref:carbohydrate ABC transporter permease n=1 Tax=Kitasatospora sp. GP30 TaxID=3035084 RepID=UPI000CAF9588|nr:sugar ABC transporter permease [Kitasatospora sp. GP30]MDH6143092.1 alpha-glucoside transport system permease protein [Kitasatospora sp. GP30]